MFEVFYAEKSWQILGITQYLHIIHRTRYLGWRVQVRYCGWDVPWVLLLGFT